MSLSLRRSLQSVFFNLAQCNPLSAENELFSHFAAKEEMLFWHLSVDKSVTFTSKWKSPIFSIACDWLHQFPNQNFSIRGFFFSHVLNLDIHQERWCFCSFSTVSSWPCPCFSIQQQRDDRKKDQGERQRISYNKCPWLGVNQGLLLTHLSSGGELWLRVNLQDPAAQSEPRLICPYT